LLRVEDSKVDVRGWGADRVKRGVLLFQRGDEDLQELALLGFTQILRVPVFCWDRCVERSEEIAKRHDGETKNCREWAAEKRNPTSEAHYDGTFPTTSRTTTNDNGIRQLTAEIWDQGKCPSDAERTTLSHRWAWREVSQIGEEFFDLLEKPFKKSVFVEFVKNAEVTSGIAEIPPLEARYRLIKGSPETRGFYEKVLTAIKKENSDGLTELYVREILSELAGMFMVLSADGMCPLTLGQFLALGKTSRERARGYPEKSYTDHQKGTQTLMVGMLMRQRQRNMAWYKNFPAQPEVVAGEAIKNVNHWRALLATADDTSAALSALSNATVVGSIAPHHRSVSEVAASRHSVAPTLQNWVLPGAVTHPTYGAPPRKDPGGGLGARKNPLGVDGPIFVGNRCAKCGHVGHRHPACPGPSHPSFKADKPWGLLTDMSHGKIRLP
jgi:hypothetical protein